MARTPKQPRPDQPHAGVDRRRNDMAGRKYTGTQWDSTDVPVQPAPKPKAIR